MIKAGAVSANSSSEDRLAACLTLPHRTEAFFSPFHRQNDTDLGLDPCLRQSGTSCSSMSWSVPMIEPVMVSWSAITGRRFKRDFEPGRTADCHQRSAPNER